MLNSVLIAYERSELHFFLKAPYHSGDITKWEAYGQTLEYLDKLLRIDNELAFFSTVSLDSFLSAPQGSQNDNTANYFESLEDIEE